LHLRQQRARSIGRPRGPRLLLFGGLVAVGLGAATFEPLAPTVLAPLSPVVEAPRPIVVPAVPTLVPPAPAVAPALRVAPLAVATSVPRPLPTPGASTQALLGGIRGDLSAQWLKNHAETALRGGPSDDAPQFTMLPQWSTLRQVQSQPGWLLVAYGGDGDTRQPGPGWVKSGDVGGIGPPSVWLNSNRSTTLWGGADAGAGRSLDLPGAALMEVIGPEPVVGGRVHVRLPGDGRQVPPAQGWVDGDALARTRTPSAFQLPRAYPSILAADVRLRVPYRTQLDGSAFESANCGPTALGMALESFGVAVAPPDLRGDVLASEEFNPEDDDAGAFIWALARVAQSHGLRAYGLYENDGETLHRWSLDDVRANVRQGRPVIAQVVYRGLPGREGSSYFEDHFVIVTGLMGEDFLYNDPIGGVRAREAPGWDRLMTAAEMRRAMRATDSPYAYTAFAIGRT
jgi:hypothetical protein